jgi:hypothetical protein
MLLDARSKTAMLTPIFHQPFLSMKMLSLMLTPVIAFPSEQSLVKFVR